MVSISEDTSKWEELEIEKLNDLKLSSFSLQTECILG